MNNKKPKRLSKGQYELRRLKADVIEGYGGKCECCGDNQIEFLVIDHTDGGGEAWRRKHGTINYGPTNKDKIGLGKHDTFYRHLRRQKYPKEVDGMKLRVLCHNCNQSLGSYGYCPHQEPERTFAEFPLRRFFMRQRSMLDET